ncbi:MAG TPA: hypothetical protein VMH05_21505 [Bryobacteraceae bacterium]|nr:hypothetical protein [Bryobacteraceae bacterium]
MSMPAGDGLLLAMADPDAGQHILADVYPAPDGVEWRFTGLHPKFRLHIQDSSKLDFYIRFFVHEESLIARGPLSFWVDINGHRFLSSRFSLPGDLEYRHAVPPAWIDAPGSVDISLDIQAPWRYPDGTIYGLYLHSIGFERRDR